MIYRPRRLDYHKQPIKNQMDQPVRFDTAIAKNTKQPHSIIYVCMPPGSDPCQFSHPSSSPLLRLPLRRGRCTGPGLLPHHVPRHVRALARDLERQLADRHLAQDVEHAHLALQLLEDPVADLDRDEGVHAVGVDRLVGIDVLDGDGERLGQLEGEPALDEFSRVGERRRGRERALELRGGVLVVLLHALDVQAAEVVVLGVVVDVGGFEVLHLLAHAAGAGAGDHLRREREVLLRVASEGRLDERKQLRRLQRHAREVGLHLGRDVHVLGHPADAGDGAEVERAGSEAEGFAVVREPVLVGVAGGVVALRAVAADARDGGQHDEEVEVFGRELVEVPAALDLGACGGDPRLVGHVFEVFIVEDHGCLDDAFDSWHLSRHLGESRLDGSGIGDITCVWHDIDTHVLQLIDGIFDPCTRIS